MDIDLKYVFVLSDEHFICWTKFSNVIFILDYPKFYNLGLITKLKKDYNCCVVDEEGSFDDVKNLMMRSTGVAKFIIDENLPNIHDLIPAMCDRVFMPIFVTFNVETLLFNAMSPFKLFPVFICWAWNNRDQKKLHNIRRNCLRQLISIDDINKKLTSKINESLADAQISEVTADRWIKQRIRLHVTSYYIGYERSQDSERYVEKVNKMFYSTSLIKVTGLLLTETSFSGHVDLPNHVEWMYNLDYSGPDHDQVSQSEIFRYLPHVTLALAPGVDAVKSGLDAFPIQQMIDVGNLPPASWEIDLGSVHDIQGQFYVTLKKPLAYSVMFCPYF